VIDARERRFRFQSEIEQEVCILEACPALIRDAIELIGLVERPCTAGSSHQRHLIRMKIELAVRSACVSYAKNDLAVALQLIA
jgi:hypothetical protein